MIRGKVEVIDDVATGFLQEAMTTFHLCLGVNTLGDARLVGDDYQMIACCFKLNQCFRHARQYLEILNEVAVVEIVFV